MHRSSSSSRVSSSISPTRRVSAPPADAHPVSLESFDEYSSYILLTPRSERACLSLGISPEELLRPAPSSFGDSVEEKIRFEHSEKRRIIKLQQCRNQRRGILAKTLESRSDSPSRSSSGRPATSPAHSEIERIARAEDRRLRLIEERHKRELAMIVQAEMKAAEIERKNAELESIRARKKNEEILRNSQRAEQFHEILMKNEQRKQSEMASMGMRANELELRNQEEK